MIWCRGPKVFYNVNGKRLREIVGSDLKTALLLHSNKQQELLSAKTGLPSQIRRTISLEALVDSFIKEKKHRIRPSSLKRYKNYLDPLKKIFMDYFPAPFADISLITIQYLREFIDNALTVNDEGLGWSKRTTNDATKIVRTLFRFAFDNDFLTSNVAKKLEIFRDPWITKADFFSEEQLELIWKTVSPHWRDPLEFICNTGLRKGELFNRKCANVDLTPGKESIRVESTDDWETKTGKFRIVPLNPTALEIIKRHITTVNEYVFLSPQGHKIHPDKIYHALKRALEKVKLEGDVHKLRHTFGSALTMKGVDLSTVGQLLGHADIKTTQIYIHLAPQHLKDAVNKLSAASASA